MRTGSASHFAEFSVLLTPECFLDINPTALYYLCMQAAEAVSVHAARGRASGVSRLTVDLVGVIQGFVCVRDRASPMHLFTS
jgi:hypothetical protein